MIRAAAAELHMSMTQFIIREGLLAAEKILKENAQRT